MRKITFVAFAYVIAGLSLLVSCVEFYERCQFWFESQSGYMATSDPVIPRTLKYGDKKDLTIAVVTYVTQTGTITVPNKVLSYSEVARLGAGEKIPVQFLKSNPRRVLIDGENLETHWSPLIVGLVSLALAIYLHFLLRREYSPLGRVM